MKTTARSDEGPRVPNRVGRPARVTPAQIAEAALGLGLDRASVRSVADALGMSVAGLYHHVRTREDLMAVAARHTIRALLIPDATGKTWDAWLLEYSRHVFDILVSHPEFIGHIVAGATDNFVHAQHLEKFLDVLGEHGFSVKEAYEIYVEIMSAVIGAAALESGPRASAAGGRSLFSDLKSAAQALSEEATPKLRSLVDSRGWHPDRFQAVQVALMGVVASRATTASGRRRRRPGSRQRPAVAP
jgi:AcrR family transcriptional regulator